MTINWTATPVPTYGNFGGPKFRVKTAPRLIVLMNSSNLMMRKSLRLAKTLED